MLTRAAVSYVVLWKTPPLILIPQSISPSFLTLCVVCAVVLFIYVSPPFRAVR